VNAFKELVQSVVCVADDQHWPLFLLLLLAHLLQMMVVFAPILLVPIKDPLLFALKCFGPKLSVVKQQVHHLQAQKGFASARRSLRKIAIKTFKENQIIK
jgi:hypothetical protein